MKIENWQIEPGMFGVTKLSGDVSGHPRHDNGKSLTTTPIKEVNVQLKTVITMSGSVYDLGLPHLFPFAEIYCGKPTKDTDPIQHLKERVSRWIESQSDYLRVKVSKEYPAPCEANPNRMYEIYTNDVLTKNENGNYTIHTCICITNIVLKDDEVEQWDKLIALSM